MNNLIVLPMVIPIIVGIIFVIFRSFIRTQRVVSLLAMLANIIISVVLLQEIVTNGIIRLEFGNWAAPFGIVFVADSFAVLLVLTTSIVSLISILYAIYSIDQQREKMFFYPFVQFLIAGVNGSFLTGDLFNLFVTFEVMLLASYVLLALGGTKRQLKVSITYITINILSSWFFLVAIAYLYGTVGTLNLAHLSVRIAEAGQTPILTIISLIFMLVFSLKAGLLLYQWLPGSYSTPPPAVAALFGALLTKVGVYAMFRLFTLVFYHEPKITHTIIGVLAALTLIGGCIGAIAYSDLRYIASYNVVVAIGFILIGLSVMTTTALQGSIHYLIHDMIVKGLLFLVIGAMAALTGSSHMERMSGLIKNYPGLGWIFFIMMLSLVGIPPFSGFVGKILVGQGTVEAGAYLLLAIGLISSVFVLYSLLRVFLNCFWGETIIDLEDEVTMKKGVMIPLSLLTILTIGLGVGSEIISPYIIDAAYTLANPNIYIEAVLQNR